MVYTVGDGSEITWFLYKVLMYIKMDFYLAAAANWFLPFGRFGSTESDLAVVSRALEEVDTLFKEWTISPRTWGSLVSPAISMDTCSKSWKAEEKSLEEEANWTYTEQIM